MIYVFGANVTGTYAHPHSEPIIGLDVAKAFSKLGRQATVAWGGGYEVVEGIPHVPWKEVQAGEEDLLFAIQGFQGATVLMDERYAGLRAGTKVLYTSSHYRNLMNGVPLVRTWAGYDQVLVEAKRAVPLIKQDLPTTPVEWCQLGCTVDVDLTAPSPYPEGEERHLFFAGRVSPWSLLRLHDYLAKTDEAYHVWVATGTVDMRVFAAGAFVPDWEPPAERLQSVGYTGPSQVYLLACSDDINVPTTLTAAHAWTTNEEAEAAVRCVVTRGDPQLDRRFHFLGPLAFGTFWHYHHHAFASIDFGFGQDMIHNNCKIIDMLRAGARVIADGYSPTHYLIEQYDAGSIVPFADMAAAAQVLDGWGAEASPLRLERAGRYRDNESWEVRLAPLLERGMFGT